MSGWPDPARPGVPLNPERNGPHELWNLPQHGGLGPAFWTWDADVQCWTLGFYMKHPEEAAQAWRYIGPCLTPAEVAAREAAAFKRGQEAMRERAALEIECGCSPDKRACVIAVRPNSRARWDTCGENNCPAIDAAAIRTLPVEEMRDDEG